MGLMPCASQEVVTTVVAQLETEKNNQGKHCWIIIGHVFYCAFHFILVASFVYSYLAEVRRSTDPEKQELKALIMAARPRRVDKDSRKFSRYYEVSQFWDSVNLGAHAESGLIFAPESFTPRQAFLNLTVDLFGTSVNFLEVFEQNCFLTKRAKSNFGFYSWAPEWKGSTIFWQKCLVVMVFSRIQSTI